MLGDSGKTKQQKKRKHVDDIEIPPVAFKVFSHLKFSHLKFSHLNVFCEITKILDRKSVVPSKYFVQPKRDIVDSMLSYNEMCKLIYEVAY